MKAENIAKLFPEDENVHSDIDHDVVASLGAKESGTVREWVKWIYILYKKVGEIQHDQHVTKKQGPSTYKEAVFDQEIANEEKNLILKKVRDLTVRLNDLAKKNNMAPVLQNTDMSDADIEVTICNYIEIYTRLENQNHSRD